MASLLLMAPLKAVATGGTAGFDRALGQDPKEGISIPAGGGSLSIDFGAVVSIDTVFLGYHSALAGQTFSVITSATLGGATVATLAAVGAVAEPGLGPPYHGFLRAAAPLSSRYWTITFQAGTAWTLGVAALGLSFAAQYGTEFGAGRPITDTGNAERLFGGGFGIDEGVRVGGYSWTFGDLQDTEIRTLYQLVKDRGTTRSVLVVEDPTFVDGLNERIHWGLFRKLDTYERTDPKNWRWSLQVDDWG